jgi:S-adenosylmethionine decarboxylase
MDKGKHLIISSRDGANLDNTILIEELLLALIEKLEMTILYGPIVLYHSASKDLESGITGFVIIAESHISIHTYPHKNYVTLDIFSCNKFDALSVLSLIKETLGGLITYFSLDRGLNYDFEPQPRGVGTRRLFSQGR